MGTPSNPKTVHPPLGAYSHTMSVAPGARWLVIAGQVGVSRTGRTASGVERQSEQAFRNVVACLRANGMNRDDLVKLTIYLTDPRGIEAMRAARIKVLGESVRPPSTLVIVDALASPDFLVEVEALAARE